MVYRCSVALRDAEFRAGDFENCIADVRRNDLLYLDPPDASTGRPRFGEYGYGCFNDSDVSRLVHGAWNWIYSARCDIPLVVLRY